ncbi:uncharacterized protein MONOS_16190 [Monocercomonoides exilis]|uniref:uncharacterized protein n=1 Tax=Monocercomonoides exilis TaxID=2049356 RepID=UPI00355A6C82|nr:hypothetical protein MONOS_16190 [Monocercomonoides exilis]|eukprot:MONOS_16190.1-p1 / transcript=MONOS_16190.1 / gene=MONOS_16190 / organism=Monocercomonoides_exilis_PA203 / gene_product=unspecified product / transcript_product=unspecified product / location=Mono_scaffold01554:3760-6930(+) / protein_length=1057 / sequence_SO=supercontig / SO=protein_coding / is_pseudo=false
MFWGLILFQIVISIYSLDDPSQPITTVFVKQSGNNSNNGLDIGQERQSLLLAYILLSNEAVCNIKFVEDENPFPAEVLTANKKTKITLEGWKSDGSGNAEVEIDCEVHEGLVLFNCYCDAEFKWLAFHIPTTLDKKGVEKFGPLSLINAQRTSLTISNCRFIRPAGGSVVDYRLVDANGGSLTMESVECADEENTFSTMREVFFASDCETVILSNLNLKKIDIVRPNEKIFAEAVVDVYSYSTDIKTDLTLKGSTFSEIKSASMVFVFKTYNKDSTFTVGDGGVTTFSSCHTDYQYGSGVLCLRMTAITSVSQIKWPEDGRNLIFDKCTFGAGKSKRSTGLLLIMANDSLFEDLAAEMKKSFAANYNRRDNLWNIVGTDNNMIYECDFVSTYYDPPLSKPENMTKAFVKNGGKGNGISVELAAYSLKDAYNFLEKSVKCIIETVKTEDPLPAEAITFDVGNGIIIEGVNSDGKGNAEVAIDCDVSASSALFTCEKEVEFKSLAFNFPTSGKKWDSLIFGNELSTSLSISNCRFVRIGAQSSTGGGIGTCVDGDGSVAGNLVKVVSGKVTLNNVSCADDSICVSFSISPFYFEGVNEISLNGVEVSNVNVQNGAAITIEDGESTPTTVSIEGLSMKEVNSENGDVAGLEISLVSEESTVAIGRNDKCSFKSCSAPNGKVGAIFIEMPKAASNIQLPAANNLEIDSSNTAGSQSSSLFIIAPDFDEFCKREDAFEFANDYGNSTAGWIAGAKDEESEPEDAYEKYLKEQKDKPKEDESKEEKESEGREGNGEEKKPFAWWIIVIVVGVVAVVAVVCVILIVTTTKKRKKKTFSKKQQILVEEEEDGYEGKEGGEEEREREREREEGENKIAKNRVKEDNSNSNENASFIQHLNNTTHENNKSNRHLQKDERKEGISSEFIEEAVNQILSSSSSVLNEEELQANKMNANLKEFVTEANTFSLQSNKQNEETRMKDEEINENEYEEEEEREKEKKKGKKRKKAKKSTHLKENDELESEKEEEEKEENEEEEEEKQEKKKKKKKKKKKSKKNEGNEEEEEK